MEFDAFLCYSHTDSHLAGLIAVRLKKLIGSARGQHRGRIFHDVSDLSAAANLRPTILKALDDSRFLILLASPSAARSQWVNVEVEYWLKRNSPETILVVLTDGQIVGDRSGVTHGQPATTALPPSLIGAFAVNAVYIDLRWAKNATADITDRFEFAQAVARLAAAVTGRSVDDIVQRSARRVRQRRQLLIMSAGVLGLFAAAFFWLSIQRTRDALVLRESALRARAVAEQLNQELTALQARQTTLESELLFRQPFSWLSPGNEGQGLSLSPLLNNEQLRIPDLLAAIGPSQVDNFVFQRLARERLQEIETLNRLLQEQKDRLQSQKTLIDSLLKPEVPKQGMVVEFIKTNAALLSAGCAITLALLALSTRYVDILLGFDLPIVRNIAALFYLTRIGRYRLFSRYEKNLLKDEQMAAASSRYVDLPFETKGVECEDKASLARALTAVLTLENASVIAEGGKGKTTLAYKIALAVLRGELQPEGKPTTPIVVDGLEYDGDLLGSITTSLQQRKVTINREVVKSLLKAGHLFVTFDGWSEVREFYVATQSQTEVANLIRQNAASRFLFTSRNELPASLQEALGRTRFYLKDVNAESLETFLKQYLPAGTDAAKLLEDRLQDTSMEVPWTPLMLRMVARIYGQHSKIPTERIELFEEYFHELLDDRVVGNADISGFTYLVEHLVRSTFLASHGVRGFEIEKGVSLLENIKAKLESYNIRQLPIDLIRKLGGAGLYQRKGSRIRFFHDSFESFFAARCLYQDVKSGLTETLAHCANEPRLAEPWQLLHEIATRERDQSLLELMAQLSQAKAIRSEAFA
ncbi:MAG TPA: TIR domain-containing protein [Chthoniobacterales bacterium]|nr:TIR domain-containing protein [Chthoniobacterales bacterium]